MRNQSLTAKRIFLNACLVMIAGLMLSAPVSAARLRQDPSERQRALDLYEANNFAAALPLLEKLAASNPNDPVILSRLGFALYASSATEKDPAVRQQMRDRARTTLLRSRSLGDNSNLTAMALDALSAPDATQLPFSSIQAAEAAMREGEAAFVRGDMDKAIAAYKHALELDPHLYDAALYAGDAEFKKGYNSTDPQYRIEHFDAAGVWFAKAVAIDANRETAYRYWGDALDAQGKSTDARDKFVDAIVADPFNRRAYVGLTQWADRHKVALGHPRIDIPSGVTSNKPGEVNITIDPSALKSDDDGSAAWMVYGIIRARWLNKKDGSRSDKFAKAYPHEPVYRHSLAEELEALAGVSESVQTQIKDKRIKKLTVSLENLKNLNDTGLLEPYILFAHPDEGIARDYSAYRKTNRDKLRRYWLEVVILK
ncbi:MAG TPA: tetratricopeptide repeat protein [Pyrinomonadaceae bacterium]|nr:tetratricopeptide repeat protein [Pyrinomonadaceae bacterium]